MIRAYGYHFVPFGTVWYVVLGLGHVCIAACVQKVLETGKERAVFGF